MIVRGMTLIYSVVVGRFSPGFLQKWKSFLEPDDGTKEGF